MLIVAGFMMSLVLALALLYFMFIQTSPSAILDLGFISYLSSNAGTALGGLIGMMALTFVVILPMLAKIPGNVRETLSQRRFRRPLNTRSRLHVGRANLLGPPPGISN